MSALDDAGRGRLAALIATSRWVALGTAEADGAPLVSQVACTFVAGAALAHLSELAAHTRNLLARPGCALSISEPDDGRADPQTLARVTLRGTARAVAPADAGYARQRTVYLDRFPAAAPRFEFADFHLFELRFDTAQFVSGFAAAFRLDARDLARIF